MNRSLFYIIANGLVLAHSGLRLTNTGTSKTVKYKTEIYFRYAFSSFQLRTTRRLHFNWLRNLNLCRSRRLSAAQILIAELAGS